MTTLQNPLGPTEEAAKLLSVLGNPKRLQVMLIVLAGEISVGELATKVELSQSALSQHLAKFRALDLVATRRDGQTIYYRSISAAAAQLIHILGEIYNIDSSISGMLRPERIR